MHRFGLSTCFRFVWVCAWASNCWTIWYLLYVELFEALLHPGLGVFIAVKTHGVQWSSFSSLSAQFRRVEDLPLMHSHRQHPPVDLFTPQSEALTHETLPPHPSPSPGQLSFSLRESRCSRDLLRVASHSVCLEQLVSLGFRTSFKPGCQGHGPAAESLDRPCYLAAWPRPMAVFLDPLCAPVTLSIVAIGCKCKRESSGTRGPTAAALPVAGHPLALGPPEPRLPPGYLGDFTYVREVLR